VLPPFVGVAVKVTAVPAQAGLADGAMLTLAERIGFTVNVIVLEVAGEPEAHVSLEVIMHFT
jgi:hypothetical protein